MNTFLAINDFCLANHTESKGSHFAGSTEELIALVSAHWDERKPGFTEGCVEVAVPPDRFFSGVVDLAAKPNAVLNAKFEARREGEDAVLSVRGEAALKAPATQVRIICYSHDLLAKDGDNSTEAEFEVITILAEVGEKAPMPPVTMARNFLNETGGTKGDFTPQQFAESIMYWARHVVAGD